MQQISYHNRIQAPSMTLITSFLNVVIRTSNVEEQYLDTLSLNKTHIVGSTQTLLKKLYSGLVTGEFHFWILFIDQLVAEELQITTMW